MRFDNLRELGKAYKSDIGPSGSSLLSVAFTSYNVRYIANLSSHIPIEPIEQLANCSSITSIRSISQVEFQIVARLGQAANLIVENSAIAPFPQRLGKQQQNPFNRQKHPQSISLLQVNSLQISQHSPQKMPATYRGEKIRLQLHRLTVNLRKSGLTIFSK